MSFPNKLPIQPKIVPQYCLVHHIHFPSEPNAPKAEILPKVEVDDHSEPSRERIYVMQELWLEYLEYRFDMYLVSKCCCISALHSLFLAVGFNLCLRHLTGRLILEVDEVAIHFVTVFVPP